MNNELDKIFKDSQKISLSQKEKDFLFNKVSSFIEMNPINENAPFKIGTQKDFSRVSPYAWFLNLRYKTSLAGALGLAVVFGGTSFAAQGALPGDVLYPIKIHVNEKIDSLLAFGPKNSAITGAKHALERIQEEEKLSAQNKLTPDIKSRLEDDFSSEVENMNKNVKNLEDKGDVQAVLNINRNFNEDLSHHYDALIDLSDTSATSGRAINTIRNSVRNNLIEKSNLLNIKKNNSSHIADHKLDTK